MPSCTNFDVCFIQFYIDENTIVWSQSWCWKFVIIMIVASQKSNVFRILVNKELAEAGFTYIPKDADEDEHSIEMHLPYIAKVMEEWVEVFFYFLNFID